MQVSAAVIIKEGRVLLCQRNRNKHHGLLWEFPGGKREPNETMEESLVRECREELDIEIAVENLLLELNIDREGSEPIDLFFFRCIQTGGKTVLREHEDARWVPVDRLESYDLCPSDRAFVEQVSLSDLMKDPKQRD